MCNLGNDPATVVKPNTRTRVDWAAAEARFYALGNKRSFGRIAREFGVSDTRVRVVAHRDNWPAKAAEIDATAHTKAVAAAVRSREQNTLAVLKLRDLAVDASTSQIEGGEDVRLADALQAVKTGELVQGNPTDHVALAEVNGVVGAVITMAFSAVQEGWTLDQLAEKVREISGAQDVIEATA